MTKHLLTGCQRDIGRSSECEGLFSAYRSRLLLKFFHERDITQKALIKTKESPV